MGAFSLPAAPFRILRTKTILLSLKEKRERRKRQIRLFRLSLSRAIHVGRLVAGPFRIGAASHSGENA